MKSAPLIICLIGLFIMGCKGTSKLDYSESELETFKSFISSGNFQIVCDWAMPLADNSLTSLGNAGLLPVGSNPGRINLFGNINYLKVFNNDSTAVYLPYFGERQIAGVYGDSSRGIDFEMAPEDLEIAFDAEKVRATIDFTANNGTEVFDVNAIIYPNLSSMIIVNSNQRRTISYNGSAKPNED